MTFVTIQFHSVIQKPTFKVFPIFSGGFIISVMLSLTADGVLSSA